MQRILQGTATLLSTTFYVDGTPTTPSPDAATVTITRSDGTALVTNGTATPGQTFGVYTYPLLTTDTAVLDTFHVAWTSSLGTLTDTVEIVGGFLFSIAEARAQNPLGDATKYPTAAIIDARTTVEQTLEDACGVAFVPRYKRELLDKRSNPALIPTMPLVRVIRSAVDAADADVASVPLVYTGTTGWYTHWGSARKRYVQVGYEHGHTEPPARIRQAALVLLKNWIVQGPIDSRTTQFTTDNQTATLMVPGRAGAYVGIPEVEAAIAEYSMGTGVA